MNIELKKLQDIKPYPQNPRQNDAAVDAVARSIQEFGFRQPIVVDEEGVIIAGHTRWKAARKLGLAEVPVHVAVGLSPEKVRAYRIADNKVADLASWDTELLPIELADLCADGLDMETLGFTTEEVEILVNGPSLGIEIDESIADNIFLCICSLCGHEHQRQSPSE